MKSRIIKCAVVALLAAVVIPLTGADGGCFAKDGWICGGGSGTLLCP